MVLADRDALIALWNATAGVGWEQDAHWNTDADLSQWQGVKVNDQGDVVELCLTANNLRGLSDLTFCSLEMCLT